MCVKAYNSNATVLFHRAGLVRPGLSSLLAQRDLGGTMVGRGSFMKIIFELWHDHKPKHKHKNVKFLKCPAPHMGGAVGGVSFKNLA